MTAPKRRPLVIAHRGASGYLPEHTLAAKAMAHAMGADCLEQDVVATRDGVPIVFHDIWLDQLTDVAERFPGRARPDGRHYCIDFDLAEIRELRVHERCGADGQARFPGRFPTDLGLFRIHTLDEELGFIRGLERSTGRPVGIYPEVKDPAWHLENGVDLATEMLAILDRHGWRGPDDDAWLQCFDGEELRRLREDLDCQLRLVQLIEFREGAPDEAALAGIATYANGIGPDLRLLMTAGEEGTAHSASPLAAAAHAAGLVVHPYTVRADELPPGFDSLEALVRFLVREAGVDGFFTDFPDRARACLASFSGNPS